MGKAESAAKPVGRPPKTTEIVDTLSLCFPPSMIEAMRQEQRAQNADSLSAVVRAAVGDYLRRMEKRRERGDVGGATA